VLFLNLLYILYLHLSYLVLGGKFPVCRIRKESLEREWCVMSCGGVPYRIRTAPPWDSFNHWIFYFSPFLIPIYEYRARGRRAFLNMLYPCMVHYWW